MRPAAPQYVAGKASCEISTADCHAMIAGSASCTPGAASLSSKGSWVDLAGDGRVTRRRPRPGMFQRQSAFGDGLLCRRGVLGSLLNASRRPRGGGGEEGDLSMIRLEESKLPELSEDGKHPA